MRNRIGFGLAAVALCAAACGQQASSQPGGGSGGPQIQPGTQVTMGVTSDMAISGSAVRVRFDSVSDDSRCKPGQHCIWEGDATVHLTVGTSALALHTSKRVKPNDGSASGYKVQLLSLDPNGKSATIQVDKA